MLFLIIMKIKKKHLKDKNKIIITFLFLGVLFILTYLFVFVLKTTVIISHFYYVPVILGCVWWKKKGLLIAFFLGGILLFFPLISGSEIINLTSMDDILRTMFLIIVGLVVSILSFKSSKSQYELRERIKELNCLYGIAKVLSNPNNPVEEILSVVLNRIKYALQFPEKSSLKIAFRGSEYETENFIKSPWKITKKIKIHNHILNFDVHYHEDVPFLKEEQILLERVLEELRATFEFKLTWLK